MSISEIGTEIIANTVDIIETRTGFTFPARWAINWAYVVIH